MIGETIVSLYLHSAEFCLGGGFCKRDWLPEEDSLCFHYRGSALKKTDNITMEDTTMWKYKDELIAGVTKTLEESGFIP